MDETTEWLRVPAAEPRGEIREAAEAQSRIIAEQYDRLGRLEETVIRLAALQGAERPSVDAVSMVLFAADHGPFASHSPVRTPTAELVRKMAGGDAAVSLLAREITARLEVIDLGIATDPGPLRGVLNQRIAPGAADFREGPAMTRHQLARAMHAGRHAAERARLADTQLFIGGAVGKGNLTSAEALACALLAVPPERLSASGGPWEDPGLERIRRGLDHHRPYLRSPLEALRRLGSFTLAALTGGYMACSHMGVPVLVDGFAGSVAALTAARLCRGAERWFLYTRAPGHCRHQCVLQALSARPFPSDGPHSEDGAGAAAAIPLLRLACSPHGKKVEGTSSAKAG